MQRLVVLTAIYISIAFPQTSLAAGGWSQVGKIKEIYNLGYAVQVKLSIDHIDFSAGNCPSIVYYSLKNDGTEAFSTKFFQILMAHASKIDIKFWINGDVCTGQDSKYQSIGSVVTYAS
ncbi:hypothetical protein [Microbulbifer agarilyticus]